MKAFVQFYDGQPFADWAYAAYWGLKNMGMDVLSYEDIGEVPLLKLQEGKVDKIVVGCIEDMISYLKRNGIAIPKPLNIPAELQSFTKRNIWMSDLGSVKTHRYAYPLFMKPADDLKLFAAEVINERYSDAEFSKLFPYPDDTQCMLSEPIDITSEYRAFVANGKLLGIKHYSGDFRIFPDASIIQKAIEAYTTAPSACTIDFGVSDKHDTVLVECNDAWSVDHYGLDGKLYAEFLLARWVELTEKRQLDV